MKRLLQLSVVLNIVLTIVALRHAAPASLPRSPRIRVEAAASFPHNTGRPTAAPSARTPWQQLDATELTTFIAHLRASGCPEQTIRDIVIFRVSREYFQRLLQMESERMRQAGLRGLSDAGWRESVYALRDLRNEMISTLESALGQSWETLYPSVLGWPLRGFDAMEGMSLDQRRLVREVKARYDRQEGPLSWQVLRGDLSLEEDARLRQLHLEQRDELAKILSAQQMEEYLYRDSDAADFVRRSLPASGSEQEFRASVRLADELGLYYTGSSPFGGAESEEIAAELKRRRTLFDERLKAILGEQRTAERLAEEKSRVEAERQRQIQKDEEQARAHMTQQLVNAGATDEQADRFAARFKELLPVLQPKFEELEKHLTGTPEENDQAMRAAMKAELTKLATEVIGNQGPAIADRLMEQMK